ncbi:MAG: hypothetical protein IKR34_00570 [Candidatus Gastranaerophilales bacterium]|nr:hypothetical protein [Candidatus Gastranaerophilales bacterium]
MSNSTQTIKMLKYSGFTNAEIAEITGITPRRVQQIISEFVEVPHFLNIENYLMLVNDGYVKLLKKDIAKYFGVHPKTLHRWEVTHKEEIILASDFVIKLDNSINALADLIGCAKEARFANKMLMSHIKTMEFFLKTLKKWKKGK